MCIGPFAAPSGNTAVTAPPPAATPTRAGEENRAAVDSSLEAERRRRGVASTNLTGGLGDTGYGASVDTPKVTALGKTA